MSKPSESAPGGGEVRGWRLVVGAVLTVFLVGSAVYDANFLGFAAAVNPGAFARAAQGESGAVFTDVTEASGLAFTRAGWEPSTTRYAAVIGGGAGVADVDGDGDEDVYLTAGDAPGETSRLFLNQGDGTFRDATEAWAAGVTGLCNGLAFGDYDDDGRPDLAVGCLGALHLLHNEGTRFTEAGAALGVRVEGLCGTEACLAASLGWLDMEGDGDLDLYVVNNVDHLRGEALGATQVFPYLAFAKAQPALLFRNDGGSFAEAAADAGVDNWGGKGLGLLVTDMDRDGRADLYVANDLTENRLYLGQGDGAFRDVSRPSGANEVKSSMGTDAADVDLDGDLDLAVTNVRGSSVSLLSNDGAGHFRYHTREAGLTPSSSGTGWGVVFFDYDLDGLPDMAHAVGTFFDPRVPDVRNQLFRNVGGGQFREVTATAGAVADEAVSRALVAFDYDLDGDEDLLVANTLGKPAQLLRNDLARGPSGPHSLQLRLEGAAANRDAIGAQVAVERPDGVTMLREVRGSCSYEASCTLLLTFGLGAHGSGKVEVHWPGGEVEDFGALPAGFHALRQGGAP